MSDLFDSLAISAHGMRVQGERTRVISENIANADTAAKTPDEQPYARKIITFKNALDRESRQRLVEVDKIKDDSRKDFPLKYMPDHPGANEAGYVKMPNVNMLIEMNDMREAQRSYEANLGMMEQSRSMMLRTIDMLR
ncbi:MAG: flagellar basal body rod protein FlgC [Rhodospirillales bacterium]|nr:flagellar basal body rod protein FlgC [Alphaproteobacteria bacterium]USO02976.1 MAG: flagellar basal body rod protein FlgC [Rhodospirillales bacterium]